MALDLEFTEMEEMLRDTALTFLKRDVSKELLQNLLDTDTGYNDEIWQKAVDMGWLGIIIPEEYGGTGFPLTSAGVLFEALGTGPLPGPYFSSGILGSLIVMEAANNETKQSILPDVAMGEKTLALALTEPEVSWELDSVKSEAVKNNGQYVIDGVKLFVTDAGAATHFIVAAYTQGASGPGLFLVSKETPGVTVTKVPGFLSLSNFEVKFDSVMVEESSLLAEGDAARQALDTAIQKAIPVLCAYKVGACQSLLGMALEYSRVRVQFGQAVGRFQRVQDLIIEMLNQGEAARWTTYEALWKLDTGQPSTESVHLAKMLASDGYWQVVTLAHQVFSGISYSMEHSVSYHTRTSRSLYNFLGEPAFHKQKLGLLLAGQ